MSGIDRISELPECLITQILACLPFKDSVKTSALSTRWKNHWLSVPVLELNYKDFPFRYDDNETFVAFVDKFLLFNPELRLQAVKLKSSCIEFNGLKDRVDIVIKRGVQHLDVKSNVCYLEEEGHCYSFTDIMPASLYTSKSLVTLKLTRSGLRDPHDFDDSGYVSLPCLKVMYLRKLRWVAPMTLEKLLEGCPVLEELTLVRDLCPESEDDEEEYVVMRVRSRSLKRFSVPPKRRYSSDARQKYVLEIDAPELEFMSLKQDHYDRIVVKNLNSLLTVDLDINFAIGTGVVFDPDDLKRNEIRDFFSGIKSVTRMIISQQTLKVLDRYSKVGPIPKFNNLSRLQAVFSRSSLQFLPALLETCPNLKHLILNIVYSDVTGEAFQIINVPRCIASSLECVEIEGLSDWKEEELKITSYFLENSAVLKKLILRFANAAPQGDSDSDIYEELNKLTKGSRGCQILIDLKLREVMRAI